VEIDNVVIKESSPITDIFYLPGDSLFEADFTGNGVAYGEAADTGALMLVDNKLVSTTNALQTSIINDADYLATLNWELLYKVSFEASAVGTFGYGITIPEDFGNV